MNLPDTTHTSFTTEANKLSARIEAAVTRDTITQYAAKLQAELDHLAKTYQADESLGAARYKLYELQAQLHYYNGNFKDAAAFAHRAMEVRGVHYPKADNLLEAIGDSNDAADPTVKPKPLRGWLLAYTLCLPFALLLNFGLMLGAIEVDHTYAEYAGGMDMSAYVSLVAALQVTTMLVIVHSMVCLLRKKSFAKSLSIFLLIMHTVSVLLILGLGYLVFGDNEEARTALNDINFLPLTLLVAAICIPYFIRSKRVKQTLVRP